MTSPKTTIGKAIDQIVDALQPFEGKDRETIVTTVCSHLQIELVSAKSEKSERHASEALHGKKDDISPREPKRNLDIRTLKEQKNPKSARQMACLVAFYLQEYAPEKEQKEAITTSDLEKYFKEANFKLPKMLEQLLVDGKNAGYFSSPTRGQYTLTRVGYNLVAHSMPSKDKS